ncbi:MAG: SAM-dependent methyltransferase [Verrucomicrobiota bacterium]
MSENHPTTPLFADACSLDYPNPAPPATSSCAFLREKIDAELAKLGSISFPDFLNLALYHPEHGYYASNPNQVGRDGDFYTSVSVGPLFGQLLARRFIQWWQDQGKPSAWRILEIGAHDGKLAADLLQTIAALSPQAWQQLEYATVEPLPLLREAQQQRLSPLAAKLHLATDFQTLSEIPLPGIAFGNEILDALPFHLIRRCENQWREVFVSSTWELITQPIDPTSTLGKKTAALGDAFPDDYQTEIRTNYLPFLSRISNSISDGMLIFIDYGFAAPEYYDTHRTRGTLRTFSKHQAAEDPLADPGKRDITAHVDFTDLAREAQTLGWHPTHFSSQGSYLTHLAAPMIQSGEMNDPKTIAQFRSLTHPAHLGASFHVIEFEKSKQPTPQVLHRLALE